MLQKVAEQFFDQIRKEKNIILWGTGAMANHTLQLLLKYYIMPEAVCDNNEDMWGTQFGGGEYKIPVLSYEEVRQRYTDYAVVLAVSIRNAMEIKEQLMEAGEEHAIYHVQNPFKVEECFLRIDESMTALADSFSDDISREIYREFLKYKATGNMFELVKKEDGNTFFDDSIILQKENHTFVDVGAYTGDTICRFLQFSRGNYEQIIGFEADEGNAEAASRFLKYGVVERAKIINMACWSEKTMLKFHTLSNKNQINYCNSNLFRSVENDISQKEKLLSLRAGENETEYDMAVDTLDNMLEGTVPTLMKVNALAADYPILLGARQIIRKYHPIIVMDYGAKPEYIVSSVRFLKEQCPDYKFFLRVKEIFKDIKTILYAVL